MDIFKLHFFITLSFVLGVLYLPAKKIIAQANVYLREPRLYPEYFKAMQKDHVEKKLNLHNAKEKIFYKNGWMEVSGKDKASQYNQLAVDYLRKYEWQEALKILDMVIKKVPYLYAARFNRGRIYLYLRRHSKAIIDFRKAKNLIPGFSGNYFFLGKAYQLAGDYDAALFQYKLGYRYNPYSLISLVAIGDLLILQKQLSEAEVYFAYALRIDDGFNDALIGMGKVAFHKGNYYDATLLFKLVDLTKNYDKALHYYYAESAFFSKMYPLAVKQYQEILKYPNDEVYNKVSLSRMKFRLRQSQKFILRK